MSRSSKIIGVRPAGLNERNEDHQVVTLESRGAGFRKQPCPTCPWRVDAVGEFPAEAFRHSARTAYDASTHVFSCHESGAEKPATCAGFLLRNADNNLGVRIAERMGRIDMAQVSDGGAELFPSYRAMAEANGVDPDDPILIPCREN